MSNRVLYFIGVAIVLTAMVLWSISVFGEANAESDHFIEYDNCIFMPYVSSFEVEYKPYATTEPPEWNGAPCMQNHDLEPTATVIFESTPTEEPIATATAEPTATIAVQPTATKDHCFKEVIVDGSVVLHPCEN